MPPEQNENEGDVKALTPVVCPHCNQSMVIEFTLTANLLNSEDTKEILNKLNSTNTEEA